MCGIAGCVAPPGREPDRDALGRMAAAIGHRGPDDRGIEVVGSVGLVHARLAIVDPSPAGHQPMSSPDGRWWIAYNGEVFNHLDLRRELGGRQWRGGSDTETLLALHERLGAAAVERCNGLFAYALLDAAEGALWLVRDRFGVKPLYLARHHGALWFASEIRALLAAGLPRRPRPDVLRHAVTFGWANGPLTPVQDVERLLPGHLSRIDLDTLERVDRAWYEPAAAVEPERAAALARRPRGELAREVEAAVRVSVRRRLMADVPVGTMCSGGLDSSLITAFARDEQPAIRAYNAAVTDQPEVDEAPQAKTVAEHLGVQLRTVAMSAATWRAELVDVVRHVEYPLTHESSVPMAQIAELARQDGVKVLLSGEGADELFGGYEWRHGRAHEDFAGRRGGLERVARTWYRRLRPRPEQRAARAAERLAAPTVREYEAQLADRARAAYRHHGGARRELEAALLVDLNAYLPHLLNRQDKSTMRASIETREPFLDPDLVALAVNLPLEARVEPELKSLLREAAAPHLPPVTLARAKVGFGFDSWRYITPAARPEFLADGQLRELSGVAREEWAGIVERARHNQALLLWTGEIWCRVTLDGATPEQVEQELWLDPVAAAA